MEEERNKPTPETRIRHNKDEKSSFKIVGINLLIFAVYTVICMAAGGKDGGVAAFAMAGFHAFIAVIIAIIMRRWVWFLSALLLLVIGFATCVSTFSLDIH